MTAVSELVEVVGDDAVAYVDSQCTQDLAALGGVGDAETLLLAPNGDVVSYAMAHVADGGHTVTLEVPSGLGIPSIERLRRFAIRTSAAISGPASVVPDDAVLMSELARIDAGIPGPLEVERGLVPHGLAPGVLERCVSFTKGCYPGQELVARMQARHATPPYVMRRFAAELELAAGDRLGDPDKDGVVTSIEPAEGGWRGLCVVHRRDAAAPTLAAVGTSAVVALLD